ncbi:MAG: type II toxin-antitoxin system prevent-host-death family antitoxin [Methylovulum miyakonense]|uniref:type II toxin-antitoxin system Phd/YefM family antitoxin n=1 Tax=Methylovulum miyakonense TaxID=645578 RepID=UPI003BB704C1
MGKIMKATAKDLRIHSKELLDAVSRGEDVTISYRGKPCAKLVPYIQQDKPLEIKGETPAFGMWADRDDMDSVEGHMQNLRKNRFA